MIRQGVDGSAVRVILDELAEHPRHEFWPDDVPYRDVPLEGVVGHRQVTDAYLVRLARAHGAKLATFDGGLAGTHRDAVDHVPTS